MELEQRAKAHGLVRSGKGPRAWWTRGRGMTSIIWNYGRSSEWVFAPPKWTMPRVVEHAPRFATEAEALSAALAWLDAGELSEVGT